MKKLAIVLGLIYSSHVFADTLTKKTSTDGTIQSQVMAIKEAAKDLSLHPSRSNQKSHMDVFCSYYSDSRVTGYSLFRSYDRADIGNSVWNSDRTQCEDAADVANYVAQDIACAPYYNKRTGDHAYSVYRISDNQDLGKATITSFSDCQKAVRYARYGTFCSTYVKDGQTWWSMYEVSTGSDVGSRVYNTLDRCIEQYW